MGSDRMGGMQRPNEALPYKAGFVAIMGRPNVGKSTLVNALLQQKIAAVSPRPQTTRKRQMGILTTDRMQAIFLDTPGVHKPLHKLGENMNQEALDALQECDVIVFLVDASQPPQPEDQMLADQIRVTSRSTPTLLVLNKVDRIEPDALQQTQEAFQALLVGAESLPISATRGDNLERFLQILTEWLPEGAAFFPEDQITDLYERDIIADLIREASLNMLRDEVPHGIAVRIDQFLEREDSGAYIEATLFVERESHKGIVIGQNGSMLKKIGMAARLAFEATSGRKVFLRLRVKVRKNWRDDEKVLRAFGF
jgi:GTP-binding protein Era